MKKSRFAKIIGILLILFLCYLGISPFIELAGKRAASVTAAAPIAFYVVIRMAMFGILAAAVFCRIFLPDIADSMVDFLLYPRKLLKKPAPNFMNSSWRASKTFSSREGTTRCLWRP